MRDILALVLIAGGAYWIWKKFDEEEKKMDEASPSVREIIREKKLQALANNGIDRSGGIRSRRMMQ